MYESRRLSAYLFKVNIGHTVVQPEDGRTDGRNAFFEVIQRNETTSKNLGRLFGRCRVTDGRLPTLRCGTRVDLRVKVCERRRRCRVAQVGCLDRRTNSQIVVVAKIHPKLHWITSDCRPKRRPELPSVPRASLLFAASARNYTRQNKLNREFI